MLEIAKFLRYETGDRNSVASNYRAARVTENSLLVPLFSSELLNVFTKDKVGNSHEVV